MSKLDSEEFNKFDSAMDQLLKVPPKVVKEAMEAEKRERAEERKTRKEQHER